MDARRVQVWIAVVAGLALVGLRLVGGNALADSPPGRVTSHQVRAAGFSSGWFQIPPGTFRDITHNLGGNTIWYTVEFMTWNPITGYNVTNYGASDDNDTWTGIDCGVLTPYMARLFRQPDDKTAEWLLVTIRVVLNDFDTLDYDSDWTDINPGQTLVLTHNVGVNPMDLTVSLWFSDTARGIHQYGHGGLWVDGPELIQGAWWQNLTTDTLEVVRGDDDTDVEQVYVRVDQTEPPDWDSGWQSLAASDRITLAHDLRWSPQMLRVRVDCYDPGGLGINLMHAGGNHTWIGGGRDEGAHFEHLTDVSVTVVRGADDQFCPQFRVLIWKQAGQVYLPAVLRSS